MSVMGKEELRKKIERKEETRVRGKEQSNSKVAYKLKLKTFSETKVLFYLYLLFVRKACMIVTCSLGIRDIQK